MEKMIFRPLSPHLTIYKPQLTSTLSIFHRISGVLLSLAFFICAFYFSFLTHFFIFHSFYFASLFFFHSISFVWLCSLVLSFILIAVCFHASNGIRHILWDFGFFLDLKSVYMTGVFCIFFTFVWFFVDIVRLLYS